MNEADTQPAKGLPVAAPVTSKYIKTTAASRRAGRVVRLMANNGQPIVLGRNAAKRARARTSD